MKQIPSSRFRRTYLAETEPVEVTAHEKPIGYWYPVGSELPEGAVTEGPTDGEDEVRFTIRPAHGPRPMMIGVVKPVLDPVEMRKQENVRREEIAARTFGRRAKPA